MTVNVAKPVLVIGAGLSGLAAARILARNKIPVVVFEQSSPTRSQGFGITLRDWAFKPLLEELGYGKEPIDNFKREVATDRGLGGTGWVDLTFRNNGTGEALFNPDPGSDETLFRANRSVLREWLAEGTDVRYDHKLVEIDGSPGQIRVAFENGSVFNGSIVIAADGVHSTSRRLLLDIAPQVLPVVLFHGKLTISRDEYAMFASQTLGGSNVAAGVGDGFNTFVTVADAEGDVVYLDWSYSRARQQDEKQQQDALWMPEGEETLKRAPQHLLKEIRARDLVPPFATLVNADSIKKNRLLNWKMRTVRISRSELDGAARRGAILIGDAAHAMPIFGGEGGNHAILDGVELARLIVQAQLASPEAALSAEQATRLVDGFYDLAAQRGQDAVKRCVQRFSGFHKPISEWLKIAQMSKSRTKAV